MSTGSACAAIGVATTPAIASAIADFLNFIILPHIKLYYVFSNINHPDTGRYLLTLAFVSLRASILDILTAIASLKFGKTTKILNVVKIQQKNQIKWPSFSKYIQTTRNVT